MGPTSTPPSRSVPPLPDRTPSCAITPAVIRCGPKPTPERDIVSTSTLEPATDESKPTPSLLARRPKLMAIAVAASVAAAFGGGVLVDHTAIHGGGAALDSSPAKASLKSGDGSPS